MPVLQPPAIQDRFGDDPTAGQQAMGRTRHDDIERLVVKLGGDPDTALFGAFADDSTDDVPVPEYPSDETDEG